MAGLVAAPTTAEHNRDMSDPVLIDPWRWLHDGERRNLTRQLDRELRRRHPLHGMEAVVVARCDHCDDVLAEVDDRWAIVHLTWQRSTKPPWPSTQLIPDAVGVTALIAAHLE